MKLYLCLLIVLDLISGARSQKVSTEFILQRIKNDSYDARVRPIAYDEIGHNGPVKVDTNIFIRRLSNIDIKSMTYDLEITLKQEWKDPRLAYKHITGQLPDGIILRDRDAVWRPDTYFSGEIRAHRHEVDTPNLMVKIEQDGTVIFTERLTLTMSCPMDLSMFPMDTQQCHVDLQSYATTNADIVYTWEGNPPRQLEGVLDTLPSYKLDRYNTTVITAKTSMFVFSCLRATLTLSRDIRHYVMHVYIPSAMLVILSWLSFWIDRTAASSRITLGVITILMMTMQATTINNNLPPVPYVKAIDVWIGACLFFLFSAVLEFVYVHQCEQRAKTISTPPNSDQSSQDKSDNNCDDGALLFNGNSDSSKKIEYSRCKIFHGKDKGERIDTMSKIVFPLAFLFFNVFYWGYYMVAKQ